MDGSLIKTNLKSFRFLRAYYRSHQKELIALNVLLVLRPTQMPLQQFGCLNPTRNRSQTLRKG